METRRRQTEERSRPRLGAFGALLEDLERHRAVDVAGRLARATELEVLAARVDDDASRMRARLVRADMLQRSGDLAEGFRLAAEVNAWAEASGHVALVARSHLVLSSVFTGAGDPSAALDHAVRSRDRLDESTPPRERANHLLCLADALALVGSADEARERYDEAQSAFAAIGDHERQLTALNNLVMLECEVHCVEAAAGAAARLAALAGEHGEMNPSFAETIARARLGVGDLAGSIEAVHEGLRLLAEQGDSQALTPAELRLAHAEVSLALGRFDEADASLVTCAEICEQRGLAGLGIEVARVSAELHAARGDYRAAYDAFRQYHRDERALYSRQRESDARTRHAVFETAEARREAQRFWRQARTDALTELPNRRFVDETLPDLLDDVTPMAGLEVVATIVDVDHFKVINDTFSHSVGDQVLQELGQLLGAAVGAEEGCRELAARLGGEEFLVVCVVDDVGVALSRMERLRRTVADHDWATVSPGLTVTISAGVALGIAGDTQLTVLGRADEQLYAAKLGGRNRVSVAPDVVHRERPNVAQPAA